MNYYYFTAKGKAVLNKRDDCKLIQLGQFKNEVDALAACKVHHAKACKAAENFNRVLPIAYFM